MTARVIDDPSTLGWELDPDTGRWVWVGDGSQGGGTGGIPEAPVDGSQYGRQDAGWTEIVGGGSFPEAPSDGEQYARQDAGWTEIDSPWETASPQGPYLIISGEYGEDDPHSDDYLYRVTWQLLPNNNYLWLDGVGGKDSDFEAAYFWDMSADVAEFGWVKNSRAASRRGEFLARRAEKGIPSATPYLEPPEIPLVVHGKIQAADVVDEDGNSIIGSGGGGGDYTGADAVKLTGDQSVAGHKTWTSIATFGDTVTCAAR